MRRTLFLVVVVLIGCKGEPRSPLREAARASAHDSEMSRPIPIFGVRNLRESQQYYRDTLGFNLDWEYGDPPDFGSVSRGDATIFLSEGPQGGGSWIIIFTRDVDRLHEELARRKAIIRMPPSDKPWGLREMQVADRDGNVIRFGSAIER